MGSRRTAGRLPGGSQNLGATPGTSCAGPQASDLHERQRHPHRGRPVEAVARRELPVRDRSRPSSWLQRVFDISRFQPKPCLSLPALSPGQRRAVLPTPGRWTTISPNQRSRRQSPTRRRSGAQLLRVSSHRGAPDRRRSECSPTSRCTASGGWERTERTLGKPPVRGGPPNPASTPTPGVPGLSAGITCRINKPHRPVAGMQLPCPRPDRLVPRVRGTVLRPALLRRRQPGRAMPGPAASPLG